MTTTQQRRLADLERASAAHNPPVIVTLELRGVTPQIDGDGKRTGPGIVTRIALVDLMPIRAKS